MAGCMESGGFDLYFVFQVSLVLDATSELQTHRTPMCRCIDLPDGTV